MGERRAAQNPLALTVADHVGEVGPPTSDERRMQRAGESAHLWPEHTGDGDRVDPLGRHLLHGR
jgi:hypothetical protein